MRKLLSCFVGILLVMYAGLSANGSVVNDSICKGSSITIGNTYPAAVLYYWTPGGYTTPTITIAPTITTQYIETALNASMQVIATDTFNVIVKPTPTVWISGTTVVCPGSPAQLIAHGADTYLWNTGMTNDTITVYPSSNTTYSVIGTAMNGCVDTATFMVIVQTPPMLYSITGDSTYCAGQSGVIIGLDGSESDCSYKLYDGNNTVMQTVTGTGFPITFGTYPAGTYTAKGFKNTLGCSSQMNGTLHVTSLPLPLAAGSITGPTTVCQNTVVNYSTMPIANATSYDWSLPNDATITLGQGTSSITVAYGNTSVSGDVKVRGHNACGDGPYASLAITVNQAPSLTITASDVDICYGESVTLTANTNATTITWNNGSTANPTTVTPLTTTVYSVTVSTASGCTATGNIMITVHPLPSVSLTLVDDHVCTDVASVELTGGLPLSGTYTAPTGCTIINNILYPPISIIGTYPVTYTYTDPVSGCSANASALIAINPVPAVSFFAVIGPVNTTTPPFDLMQLVSPIGGTFIGDGVVESMFNPTVAGAGTHMITYTYVHPVTGCSASQIQYIAVGGLGIDETMAAIAAISLFPNPTEQVLYLNNVDTKELKRVRIVDVMGQTMYTTSTITEAMSIDVSSLAPGTYFISFTNADGFAQGKKFVKR